MAVYCAECVIDVLDVIATHYYESVDIMMTYFLTTFSVNPLLSTTVDTAHWANIQIWINLWEKIRINSTSPQFYMGTQQVLHFPGGG